MIQACDGQALALFEGVAPWMIWLGVWEPVWETPPRESACLALTLRWSRLTLRVYISRSSGEAPTHEDAAVAGGVVREWVREQLLSNEVHEWSEDFLRTHLLPLFPGAFEGWQLDGMTLLWM